MMDPKKRGDLTANYSIPETVFFLSPTWRRGIMATKRKEKINAMEIRHQAKEIFRP